MEDVKEEETVQRQPNVSHSAPSCSANPRHRYKDAPDPKEGAALFLFFFPAAAAEVNLLFWLSVQMIRGSEVKG